MCISAKTEICHFGHNHIHNIILSQHFRSRVLEQKVARLVKWISGHVCELLLTSFLTSNSPNRAMFILYRHHSMWLKNQHWGVRCYVCWCGIETNKVCWMHSCSCLCDIFNCIFEQEQPLASLLLLALADAIPLREAIQHHASCLFPAQPLLHILLALAYIGSLPRLIQQFTRDIASCLHELLTFKECCGLDTCGCGFEQISCGATTCLQAALSAGRGLWTNLPFW